MLLTTNLSHATRLGLSTELVSAWVTPLQQYLHRNSKAVCDIGRVAL